MTKRSLQTKVAQLQSHFKGEDKENEDQGEWSQENLAKNRQKYYRENCPWVLEGLSCSDWYDLKIKPLQDNKAA